jgi:hypothetical protein
MNRDGEVVLMKTNLIFGAVRFLFFEPEVGHSHDQNHDDQNPNNREDQKLFHRLTFRVQTGANQGNKTFKEYFLSCIKLLPQPVFLRFLKRIRIWTHLGLLSTWLLYFLFLPYYHHGSSQIRW